MSARAQGILDQRTMTTCLPGVNPLLNPLSDCVGCGDMMGLLQDHRLKENEPLRVPQSVPHPTQLLHQVHHKASPNITTWHVVPPEGNDRKVTLLPHSSLIITNASMKVSAKVGVNPVPIDLLESEVFRGEGVAQQIFPPPLPVLLIQRFVAPTPLLHPAGICLGRSSSCD